LRSHRALIVGGTGLYIKGLMDGIFEGPSKNLQIRKRLEETDSQILYARLKEVDPIAASKIEIQNRRRVIRALEVYEMTGRPISGFQKEWNGPQHELCIVGLERERENLYQRIHERVDRMFAEGLVDELETLLEQGVDQNPIVMQAIGYKEGIAYLRGQCTLEDAKTLIKQNTRHLAKRQMTWFKKDSRIHWFKFQPNESSSKMVQRIYEFLKDQLCIDKWKGL
jgi:tRNA dimethylallyltransferase